MSTTKKPYDNAFTQQKLPAWQPVLSPPWVIALFLIIFIVFTPLGIFILIASNNIKEYELDYTEKCTMTYQNDTFGNPDKTLGQQCIVNYPFTVTERMDPPIYMYYKLENFYQNHRRYASSRNDYQLQGLTKYFKDVSGDCYPIVQYAADQGSVFNATSSAKGIERETYNPCGLIAWSMFNDTFLLTKSDGSMVCNGPNPIGSKCTKEGIAWSSDVQYKFRPVAPGFRSWPNDYYNETGHIIPQTNDTDLIVWMRTAALPNFRKLHRIINSPMDAGDYSFTIVQNYPVTQFGGRKKIVLSTASWIGGKNLFLAICYLVVGGLCLLLAFGFLVAQFVYKNCRKK
jgi:hypothetical protein